MVESDLSEFNEAEQLPDVIATTSIVSLPTVLLGVSTVVLRVSTVLLGVSTVVLRVSTDSS